MPKRAHHIISQKCKELHLSLFSNCNKKAGNWTLKIYLKENHLPWLRGNSIQATQSVVQANRSAFLAYRRLRLALCNIYITYSSLKESIWVGFCLQGNYLVTKSADYRKQNSPTGFEDGYGLLPHSRKNRDITESGSILDKVTRRLIQTVLRRKKTISSFQSV